MDKLTKRNIDIYNKEHVSQKIIPIVSMSLLDQQISNCAYQEKRKPK